MDFLRKCDMLVITRVPARSVKDLQDIVQGLKQRGITLRATEPPIDTGTAAGKAFLGMLGVFAEFETNLRKERQVEGIARAKGNLSENGELAGRPAKVSRERIREIRANGKRVAISCAS
jgi:DNA invertase Pin-like site-specific DNA recombinase